MIDRRLLREDPDRVRVAMAQKGMADVDLEAVLELDGRWRAQKQEVDDLRHQRNTISREVGELKAAGEDAAAAAAIDRSQSVNAALDELEAETEALERELIEALMRIPQLPDPAVPVGEDESDNVQLRRGASRPSAASPTRSSRTMTWASRWGSSTSTAGRRSPVVASTSPSGRGRCWSMH